MLKFQIYDYFDDLVSKIDLKAENLHLLSHYQNETDKQRIDLKRDTFIENILVEFSLKTGTSTPLFNTRKNHNSDANTILPLF
jgi:hypothetical protein